MNHSQTSPGRLHWLLGLTLCYDLLTDKWQRPLS